MKKIVVFLVSVMLVLPNMSFAGRLNKERMPDPIDEKKPSAVSKAYWSANTWASADSVTTGIGTDMIKWGFGLSVVFAILTLIFSIGEQGQHAHVHNGDDSGL